MLRLGKWFFFSLKLCLLAGRADRPPPLFAGPSFFWSSLLFFETPSVLYSELELSFLFEFLPMNALGPVLPSVRLISFCRFHSGHPIVDPTPPFLFVFFTRQLFFSHFSARPFLGVSPDSKRSLATIPPPLRLLDPAQPLPLHEFCSPFYEPGFVRF